MNVHDFYNLLDCVYDQLGGASSGQKILDAGCGIGNYGLFLLTRQLYRVQQDLQILSRDPIRYFGIDFVRSAITEAQVRMKQLLDDYREKISTTAGSSVFWKVILCLRISMLESRSPRISLIKYAVTWYSLMFRNRNSRCENFGGFSVPVAKWFSRVSNQALICQRFIEISYPWRKVRENSRRVGSC